MFRTITSKLVSVSLSVSFSHLLTFGSSKHKAKTLAVLLLQKHRLLLDYIVASREETEEGHALDSTSAFIHEDNRWELKLSIQKLQSPQCLPPWCYTLNSSSCTN